MIPRTRTWSLTTFLVLVALAAAPAFAQPCDLLDSGQPRSQAMIDRLPECGGVAPVIPAQPLAGGGSLTTLFASNNGFAGNTFDLEVLGPDDLIITSFDVNIETGASGPKTVTVYYRLGTSVGSENTPGAWTLMGSESGITSAGVDLPTPVNVGGLTMVPGQVYGIYVDLTSYDGGDALVYTNGGPTVFANADLQLTTNTGQAAPTFSGSFFPRQFNGTVYYDLAGPPVNLVDVPTLGGLGLLALLLCLAGAAFMMMRRRRNA